MEDGLNALPSCGDVEARARKRDRAEDLVIILNFLVLLDLDFGNFGRGVLRL